MARNFVIGIGGTGARCVESFLHLCAAGLGPDKVSVGLIDQDETNGNVDRTKVLATSLAGLRRLLRQDGGHKLDPAAPFLRTEVELIGSSGSWCPLSGARPQVREAFGYATMNDATRALFEALFDTGEREMLLDEGYRARPSVGAAILAGKAFGTDPFWQSLSNDLKQSAGGDGSRVFIFGSLFGGTGAAGFPTLARIVREHPLMKGITGIRLAGSLMLPYFLYDEPKASEQNNDEGDGNEAPPKKEASTKSETIKARPSEFIKQTEGALRYYNRLFNTNTDGAPPIYDQVYMIGWNPLIRIPYLADGGPLQRNPPMVPELYAALAACRFLGATSLPAPGAAAQFYKIGTRDPEMVTWNDLPPVIQGDGESDEIARERVRHALGRHMRFCFAYRRAYRPALLLDTWRRHRREEWFRRQLVRAGVDLSDKPVQSVLDLVDDHAEDHLRWAAALAACGAGGVTRPLYDFQYYARVDRQRERDPFAVVMHDEIRRTRDGESPLPVAERKEVLENDRGQRDGYGKLLRSPNDAGSDEARVGEGSLHQLMRCLTYDKLNRHHQKLGRFVGELHAACGRTDR